MKKIETDQEQKDILLKLLVYFDNLCKKYGLKYTLYAGTLLGAIRHKGFIPWDDDIDVLMPLPDYLKFMEIPEILNPENRYVLHCSKTEKDNHEHYVYPYPKLEDSRTKVVVETTYDQGGMFLDIFPLLDFPTGSNEVNKMAKKITKIKNRIVCSTRKPPKNDILRTIKYRYCYRHYQKYRDKMEKVAVNMGYGNSTEVGQPIWADYKENLINEHFSKEWMSDYVEVPFEGYQLKVISQYEKLLELEYGDWQKLPPKAEQVNKHGFDVFFE